MSSGKPLDLRGNGINRNGEKKGGRGTRGELPLFMGEAGPFGVGEKPGGGEGAPAQGGRGPFFGLVWGSDGRGEGEGGAQKKEKKGGKKLLVFFF